MGSRIAAATRLRRTYYACGNEGKLPVAISIQPRQRGDGDRCVLVGVRRFCPRPRGACIVQTGMPADLTGKSASAPKLVAVVYADMVGYSRLIGLDDVGTLARLRALRGDIIDPAISEHAGRIVQTGGDSLLIV